MSNARQHASALILFFPWEKRMLRAQKQAQQKRRNSAKAKKNTGRSASIISIY